MKKQSIAAVFTLVSFLSPLPAKAASFLSEITGIYAFGDSLTDTGNVFSATGGAFPPQTITLGPLTVNAYFNGRFSNGLNWIDYLSQSLGSSSPSPFLSGLPPTGGLNFATAGATTGFANTLDNIPGLPGLQQQVGAFTSLIPPGASADPNGLYIVWGGANDYLPTNSLNFTPFETPDQTLENLSSAITALTGVGAKNILVVNLPDLGATPRASGNDLLFPLPPDAPTPQELNNLTEEHNTQLSAVLKNLNKSLDPGVNLISFDMNSLFDEALANPSSFGFTNTTDPCFFSPLCLLDPQQQQQYLFWDGIHPTARGYQVIAEGALAALSQSHPQESVPEPSTVIGILGFGFLLLKLSPSKGQGRRGAEVKGK